MTAIIVSMSECPQILCPPQNFPYMCTLFCMTIAVTFYERFVHDLRFAMGGGGSKSETPVKADVVSVDNSQHTGFRLADIELSDPGNWALVILVAGMSLWIYMKCQKCKKRRRARRMARDNLLVNGTASALPAPLKPTPAEEPPKSPTTIIQFPMGAMGATQQPMSLGARNMSLPCLIGPTETARFVAAHQSLQV